MVKKALRSSQNRSPSLRYPSTPVAKCLASKVICIFKKTPKRACIQEESKCGFVSGSKLSKCQFSVDSPTSEPTSQGNRLTALLRGISFGKCGSDGFRSGKKKEDKV